MTKVVSSARSARKVAERVDLGFYALPLRYLDWTASKRGSWGGKASLFALRVVIALTIALALKLVWGVPANAFSVLVLVAFCLGSGLAGPAAFLLWSLLFVGITGVAGGFIGGAWIASPSWWRTVAQRLADGGSIPGWFVASVPVWLLIWIAGGRGFAKVFDMGFENGWQRLMLFVAGKRMREDALTHESALAETNLSDIEARSHVGVIYADGASGAALASPPRIRSDDARAEADPGDFEDDEEVMIQEPGDVPDYEKLLGGSSSGDHAEEIARAAGGIGARHDTISLAKSDKETFSSPSLPAPPQEPVQRAETSPSSRRANAVLQRRLNALQLALRQAHEQNAIEDFISRHGDLIRGMGEEEYSILDSMDDGHALIRMSDELKAIAASRAAQPVVDADAAAAFMKGESMPSLNNGVETDAASHDGGRAEENEDSAANEASVAGDEESGRDVSTEPASTGDPSQSIPGNVSKENLESWTSALANALAGDLARPAPGPEASVDAVTPGVSKEPVPDRASADSLESDDGRELNDGEGETIPASAEGDTKPSAVPVASDADAESGAADGVPVVVAPGGLRFEISIEEESEAPAGGDNGPEAPDHHNEPLDRMENMVTNQVLLPHVLVVSGILKMPNSAAEKASLIMKAEAQQPGLSALNTVESREFDEVLGEQEAARFRHVWKDVKALLSGSVQDRIRRDFDRINRRAQRLIDEPHALDRAMFNSIEVESRRLRAEVARLPDETRSVVEDGSFAENIKLIDRLEKIIVERETHDVSKSPDRDLEDNNARQGRERIGPLLGRARKDGLGFIGRSSPSVGSEKAHSGVVDGDAAPEVYEVPPAPVSDSAPKEDAGEASDAASGSENARRPAHGDEDYVSPFPEGSVAYEDDMVAHRAVLEHRRAREKAERERAEKKEAERRAAEERAKREREAAERAEKEAQALELKRLAAEAARAEEEAKRSKLDTIIAKSVKERYKAAELPPRFQTDDVIAAALIMFEREALRKQISAMSMGPAMDVDAVTLARSHPNRRALLAADVILGNAAKEFYAKAVILLDAPHPEDQKAVEAMLEDVAERKFFGRVFNAINSGATAAELLEKVAQADAEDARLAAAAKDIDDLRRRLEEAETAARKNEEAAIAERKAREEAERQAAAARAEMEKIQREMSGVIDDEFQRVLEARTTPIEGVGMDGFYQFVSANETEVTVVITAGEAAMPGGLVKRGNKAVPVADFVAFVCRKAETPACEKFRVFYTDSKLRPYLQDATEFFALHLERDAEVLSNYLK